MSRTLIGENRPVILCWALNLNHLILFSCYVASTSQSSIEFLSAAGWRIKFHKKPAKRLIPIFNTCPPFGGFNACPAWPEPVEGSLPKGQYSIKNDSLKTRNTPKKSRQKPPKSHSFLQKSAHFRKKPTTSAHFCPLFSPFPKNSARLALWYLSISYPT